MKGFARICFKVGLGFIEGWFRGLRWLGFGYIYRLGLGYIQAWSRFHLGLV